MEEKASYILNKIGSAALAIFRRIGQKLKRVVAFFDRDIDHFHSTKVHEKHADSLYSLADKLYAAALVTPFTLFFKGAGYKPFLFIMGGVVLVAFGIVLKNYANEIYEGIENGKRKRSYRRRMGT